MLLGIRPTNDFAFKKTFGSPENRAALISLLNAIIQPPKPIVDVVLVNPFNQQDFQDDKLSILDIKAIDSLGAVYDIEVQMAIFEGLVKRVVYYSCELYAGQLHAGDEYPQLRPVYSIWLLGGALWPDSPQVHHCFRLADLQSGRALDGTLEIHTLELAKYNLKEEDLASADELDCWLYWLLHAHEYEPEALLKLLPQPAIRQATETLIRIAEITEDKIMYDSREKAIRDRKWDLGDAFREGEAKGEARGEARGEAKGEARGEARGEAKGRIELIRTLQSILYLPLSEEDVLRAMSLEQLAALSDDLQAKLRRRMPA